MLDSLYLGRFQQGSEIAMVLQCTNADGAIGDPSHLPWVQIWRDGILTPISMIVSHQIPSDMRGVEDGAFRLPLFLGSLFATSGRYVAVFKWLDSGGVPQTRSAGFHVLPGGSADGSVISMFFSSRPDATYIMFQCDSGRLIRKPNPR